MSRIRAPWYLTIFMEKCDGCIKLGELMCVKFCPAGSTGSLMKGCCGEATKLYLWLHDNVKAFVRKLFPQRTPFVQITREEDHLSKRVKCESCGKIFLANKDANLCFDCRGSWSIRL